VTIDGWNYDFSQAPRSLGVEIIVILRDRENAWTRYSWEGPVSTVYWDSGVYGDGPKHPESVGWTTGSCGRYDDHEFECWRPMPPKRQGSVVPLHSARGVRP
jgi:hypothetical protein